MKKTLFVISASIVLVSACTSEKISTSSNYSIEAYSAPSVKTHLSEASGNTYQVLWDSDDAINVGGCISTSVTVGQDGTGATFTFSTEPTVPYCAVCPASVVNGFDSNEASITIPATQSLKNGTFDDDATVFVGKAEGPVSFSHAMSFLKIVPEIGERHTGEKIVSVNLKTAGEAVSGSFKVDFSGDTPVMSAAEAGTSDELAIDCGEYGTDGEIIIAVPAQSYAAGMTLTLTDNAGHVYTGSSTAALAAIAGKMYRMPVSFNPEILPAVPSNVQISDIGGTYARVYWTAAKRAVSYNVYIGDALVAENVAYCQYTLTGLEANTLYDVKVSAVNSFGESDKVSTGFTTIKKADLEVAFDFASTPDTWPVTYKSVNNAVKSWQIGDITYNFNLTSVWTNKSTGNLSIWRYSGATAVQRLGLPVVPGYLLSKVYVELPSRGSKGDSDLGVIQGGDTLNYVAPKVEFSKDTDNAATYIIGGDVLPRQYSLYQEGTTGIVIRKLVLSYVRDEAEEFTYTLDLSKNIFDLTATGVKSTAYPEYVSGFGFKCRGAKWASSSSTALAITYSGGYHGLSIPGVPGYKAKKIVATGGNSNQAAYYGYVTTEVSASSASKKVNVGEISLYFNPDDRTVAGAAKSGTGAGDFEWEIIQTKVEENQELFFMVSKAILTKFSVTYVKAE